MATIDVAVAETALDQKMATWEGLVDTDDGAPVALPPGTKAAGVQVKGTIGGATVELECSNDGTNWESLPTSAISLSAAGVAAIDPADLGFRLYRPNVTGGTDSDIDVTLFMRVR